MAEATVTPGPAVDHAAVIKGLKGLELKEGAGYDRVLLGGKTIAYLKAGMVTVRAESKPPKKLGTFQAEGNGVWTGARVESTEAARAIIGHVAAWAAARANGKTAEA